MRTKLPKGRYAIVASALKPGTKGPFYLSLYFDRPVFELKTYEIQTRKTRKYTLTLILLQHQKLQKKKIIMR